MDKELFLQKLLDAEETLFHVSFPSCTMNRIALTRFRRQS